MAVKGGTGRDALHYRVVLADIIELTPYNKVFKQLTSDLLLKKFSALYGTRKFITVIIRAP
jgi:FAD/FMN-containing dehydrogenase